MRNYLNRFIYSVNILSPICGCGLIVSGLAISNFSFLIAGGLNIILFYVTSEMGYRLFDFAAIDRSFIFLNLPPMSPDVAARYDEADKLIEMLIQETFDDVYHKQEIRRKLRKMQLAEKDLMPEEQVFLILEEKIVSHNLHF